MNRFPFSLDACGHRPPGRAWSQTFSPPRRVGAPSRFLSWLLLLLSLAAAPGAFANSPVTIECGRTTKKGEVILHLFLCADKDCRHGVPCKVTVPDIPANTSGPNKATRIANAIRKSKCAQRLTATPKGAIVTIEDPKGDGVVCDKVVDSTGETMHVTNGVEEVEVTYVSRGKLHGSPTSGTAMLGFNGITHTVSTAGKTLPQIYAEWQAAFGEGVVTVDGLTLPARPGLPRSFHFEVTDPGLDIEVTQSDPARSVPPEQASLGTNHFIGVVPLDLGSFTVIGGGNDAWDNLDECTFASEPLAGDFDVQVRVEGLQANSQWTKAGLMVRETLSESSRMAFNRVTPSLIASDGHPGANESRFAYRTGHDESATGGGVNGGRHEEGTGTPDFPNAWLRLEREGHWLRGYRSTDGERWILQGQQDTATWAGGPLPRALHVGVAISKGPSGGPTATAQFREYSVWQPKRPGPLSVLSASSEGHPTGIKVALTRPVRDDATNLWHWSLSPGSITGAQGTAEADAVWLQTAAPLVAGQTYTLTISNVFGRDFDEPLTPNPAVFRFTHGAGYEARRIRLERWNFISGGSVEPILASQAYARDLPDAVYSNSLFEDITPEAQNDFSGRIFGVLNITTTGDYRFFACSDDSSRLYLSTDDQSAHKIEIAREPEWNNARQYATLDRRGPNRANVSAPIRLEAGKRYFLEQVFAEGYLGNNASVAWQPPGAPEPGNGALPIPQSAFVAARYFKGTIFYALGPVRLLAQPMDQTISNGLTATFAVRADGTPPYSYQWQSASGGLLFEDIPNATSASFTHPVALPDNGTRIRCIVRNEFSGATSAVAQLTVPGCQLGIIQQPADATVSAGQTVTFTVGATGTPAAATHQWQMGPGSEPFTNLLLATSATLTLTAGLEHNGLQVRCLVGNGCTNVFSDPARLTVRSPAPSHDFAAQGLALAPLGLGVYEVTPQVSVSFGASATNPVPLDFVILVNGVLRHDGRNTIAAEATHSCPQACTGGCVGFIGTRKYEGNCQGGAPDGCNCIAIASLDAIALTLAPGDVVQLVLDPDHRVSEFSESNNSYALTFDPPQPTGTVLIFEPGIDLTPVPDTYGDRVTGPIDVHGHRYAPGSGGTSNIVVEYGPPGSQVRLATGPYGALVNMACQEDGDFGALEIQLIADPGHQVALRGFDLAALADDVILPRVEVLGSYGVALQVADDVWVPGLGGTSARFDFSAAPLVSGSILIRIDLSSLDDTDSHLVGIDNISFSQVAGTGCPPPPPLTISRSGRNIVLSWPGPGYRLETTTAIGSSAAAAWSSVDGSSPVTLPIARSGAQFFRLVCP